MRYREGGVHIRQPIEIRPAVDRAILVGGARRRNGDRAKLDEHLEELGRLAHTAGASVVGRALQRFDAPHPAYYIGHGKVASLQQQVRDAAATLVVFDEELSPAQGKNLEAALGVRVMDRAELILDIFATRAQSKEAKMQVELAQLEYLLPRLARMWVHLSRIRGGIGLRGPGETQLETDRRMIRRKITTLKRKLADVARHRAVVRARVGRRKVYTVALVGYTNAGKSSLLHALSGARVFIEDRLFATLDTKSREVVVDGITQEDGAGHRVRLVDTVGFIRKLPHHLVASFRATLEEVQQADILAHVIDASQPQWEQQVEVVDRVLGELDNGATPVVHVFNKMDLVPEPAVFRDLVMSRYGNPAFVSAERGAISGFLEAVRGLLRPTTALS